MLRPITIEELKKRIKDIHGDTVLLDESTYIDFSSKCFFIDKDYGRWECLPNNVARGHGHKLRGKQIAKKKTTISIEDTKKEIYKLYGNTITLDESTFVNRHTKAKFIDIDYGEWWATPSHVISDNSGHPARRNLKISEKNTKNTILIAKL